ncbi:GNAT family N-acetyltransferase [Brachybacterium huguangmaarense]|uniref:GNAT family N-acetyltransferase n=1 Tax=Brachybacterium huguangmaarense TaxID=1652028 RepID=A0ABY6G1C1_9MICO|nr:GNAT family N-acetyltransferase [Brachybacterium huguangmaarense]UYG16483.1 GNAT family N-acetyltransferase [Brachybacterium huguangmaarense]
MAARRDEAPARPPRRAPVPYPAHWEADIALRDGTAAHLRPILPSDAQALQRFHMAQSEQSRYFRFFAPMPELSPRDLERFTVVDHRDREALIVLHGDEIIAVGRYDRVEPTEAEVAFNVSDHYQGKGLGSVLLEHLAAAAREVGIHTFIAEVLPQNHRMISVFTDAGFDIRRSFDDGVVAVEFAIDPTARSEAVRAEREHRAEARAMERMLTPASVLVVGVSASRDSVGGRILRALESSGYDGLVHVVTRDAFEVGGRRAYSRISEVPGPVDMAVLALRAVDAVDAISQCAAIGVGSLVIPSEGFADIGEDGARLQRELVARARRHGMRLLGPAAFGFLRTGERPINVSLSPRLPRPGSTALAGQSSALAAMILAGADARGVGVAEFVGSGNRADVSINDCLQRWDEDPAVSVIGLALESMGNPRKFTRLARRVTRTKPVVVLRPPGLTGTAPPGHEVRTSALPRRALDQVLASAGVVPTRSVDHLADVLEMLDREGVPPGTRVGLIANNPALGASLRGAADDFGLEVAAENRAVPLREDPRLILRAFTRMAAPGGVDVVVLGILDPLTADLADLLRQLATVADGSAVALVVCVVSDPERYEALRAQVREDHVLPPLHTTPALAMRAAAGAIAHVRRPLADDAEPAERADVDREGARARVRALLEACDDPARGLELDTAQARALLAAYGLDLLDSRVVEDEEQALAAASELGYPVALKSTDPLLAHRADLGGVRLDIPDAVQLRHAHAAMRRELGFSSAPLLVQPMAPTGVAVVVRSQEDPSLGPVVSFSLAGDAADLLGDVAYDIPPFTEAGAARLVARPATAVKLDGNRGLPAVDRAALAETVIRVGLMAEDLPELETLELYPVVVSVHGAALVGARIHLATAPNRTDGARRALLDPDELGGGAGGRARMAT